MSNLTKRRRLIPQVFQHFRQSKNIGSRIAVILFRSVSRRHQSRQQRRAADCTRGAGDEGSIERHSFGRELVNGRCLDVVPTEQRQVSGRQIVGEVNHDIRRPSFRIA